MYQDYKKKMGLFISIVIIVISMTPQFNTLVNFPKEIRMLEGDNREININLPGVLTILSDSDGFLKVNDSVIQQNSVIDVNLRETLNFEALERGRVNLKLKFFGIVPFREIVVNVLPKKYVVPGGHSIGVRIKSKGIMVVDIAKVKGDSGRFVSPAEQSGIRVGDLILEVNGKAVESIEEFALGVKESNGRTINLKIQRNGSIFERMVTPILCTEDKEYRIGLWIRDSAVGVGTLTFYDPETKKLGALGHIIADADTGESIIPKEGRIIGANVVAIQKGSKGRPGEKRSVFDEKSSILGYIEKNTDFGIFGFSEKEIINELLPYQIPVALINQVETGPAEIFTVLQNNTIERFSIEIVRVLKQSAPDSKGMIIRVTDPKLLEITGGIIQGMSGSPIIQNNKLVGAVTHVFVNDPTRGYGVFAEWMLTEAGININ